MAATPRMNLNDYGNSSHLDNGINITAPSVWRISPFGIENSYHGAALDSGPPPGYALPRYGFIQVGGITIQNWNGDAGVSRICWVVCSIRERFPGMGLHANGLQSFYWIYGAFWLGHQTALIYLLGTRWQAQVRGIRIGIC